MLGAIRKAGEVNKPLPVAERNWQWKEYARHAAMPATIISAKSMKAPTSIVRVHSKPRTGVWPQQVIGRPGTAYSVALTPSRGSFDRQKTLDPLSRRSGVRRTGGWGSGALGEPMP